MRFDANGFCSTRCSLIPCDAIWWCLQGVANRGASIRVGRDTEREGKGYFEDRRPASNMDPYVVTGMIAETTILWKGN
jgi:glutamine synthetase